MIGARSTARFLVLAFLTALVSCAPADEEAETETETTSAAQPSEVALTLPDTVAAAVWDYLQASNYQEEWSTWPDKGELYPGGEPHGALLTTYLNDAGLEGVRAGAGAIPVNGIVVKENYMPDSTLAAVTVMYKVQGYNPENADWWFAKFMPDGSLDEMPDGTAMEGRVPGCTNCHGSVRDNDFIFTSPLGEGM